MINLTKLNLGKFLFEDVSSTDLPTEAKNILSLNKDKLAKKGINVDSLKVLGVGTMGVAYDLGDKVLKVTRDLREAKASSLVAGKDIPNIIKVYDIWQFQKTNWYGLIIEKLRPLSKEEEDALTKTVINTRFTVLLSQAEDDWNKAMQMLAQRSMNSVVKDAYRKMPEFDPEKGGEGIRNPKVKEFVNQKTAEIINDFNKLTKEYNMKQLFKSLKQLGIQYYDFHGGNYGRREDGTLVLFDLGRSISKGAEPQELTEKFTMIERNFGKSLMEIYAI